MNFHAYKSRLPWKQLAVADAKGFHTEVGAFVTGIVGGGAVTIPDQDRPELVVSVPAGLMIFPIRIQFSAVIPNIAADADYEMALVAVDVTGAWDATGTATTETPTNMKNGGAASGCTVRSAFTANMTNPTLSKELYKGMMTAELITGVGSLWTPSLPVYEPEIPHQIVGPAMLICYFGGSVATTGYINADWLEFETA